MTVANLRYNHLAFPWDSPLSYGVQAFIEYNGVVLNNRYQSDVIRVTGINFSKEIRDARQPRASKHGEYAYDAFYGGRNIVINGYFEAGSPQVLKKLERNVKAAFSPLVESPLKFRWFDIEDNFEDPQTIFPYNAIPDEVTGNYEALIGSYSHFKVENGSLYWLTASNNYLLRVAEKRTFCDAQSTLKITIGSTTTTSTAGFIHAVKNEKNYLRMLYCQNSGEPYLTIYSVVEGTIFELEKISIPAASRPVVGQSIWFRGRKEGNLITVEYWNKKPEENTLPNTFASYTLTGTDIELFGDEILAQVGFGGEQKDTLWTFDEFKIESLYPGDVIMNARTLTDPSIKDEQTSLTKFKRAYQLTLKASDFRAFSSTQIRKSIVPSEAASPTLGRVYPRSYPLSYRHYTNTNIISQDNIISINNRGTVFIEPILVYYGASKGLYLENLTNGNKMVWNGELTDGERIIIDCFGETIVNQNGADKIEFLTPTLQWIKLEPGWNDIYVSGSGFSENTKLVVYGRHGFIE